MLAWPHRTEARTPRGLGLRTLREDSARLGTSSVVVVVVMATSFYITRTFVSLLQGPSKLNDAANLAKFVRNILPGILLEMQEEHNWPNVPRTVVHDKASYMVTSAHDRLQQTFAAALTAAGFCSWVGGASDSTKWLVKKWGDVYLHETVISHIRRLLDDDFACRRLGETVPQFTQRMHKVADYMNSPAFAATDGRGLQGLAAQLHTRCQWVVRHKGQRYPK